MLKSNEVEHQPVPSSCNDDSDFGGGNLKQYEVNDLGRIWWRVVCVNEIADPPTKSVVGPTGHLERLNVWTHVAGALLYAFYIPLRDATPMGKTDTVSSRLAALSYAAFIFTFSLSTVYHVYSANRFWSAVTRLGDYFGIWTGIACGTLSDLAIVANNLRGLRTEAVIDVFVAMGLLVLFFTLRRTTLTIEETRLAYMTSKCNLGLSRLTNVDLEHSALRAASGTALSFSWVLVLPLAFRTLETDCAWVFVASRVFGTSLLVGGMILDNWFLYPDAWFSKDHKPSHCACYSTKPGVCGGWAMTAHALWHIIAVLATVVTTIGSEYVIAFSDKLRSTEA